MSSIIQYLESIGRDATFGALGPEQYAAAIAALEIDDASRQALLRRDATALNDVLGGRPTMFCLIAPAEDDDDQGEDEQDDKQQDDQKIIQ